MRVRKISFKFKLILFLEIFVIAANATIAFFVWKELQTNVREITRKKVMAIANSTAALIDAETYEKIQNEEDYDSEEFLKIREALQKVMAVNPDVNDLYTMRPTGEGNIWIFVVGGFETYDEDGDGTIGPEEEEVGLGEEFDTTEYPYMQKGIEEATAEYKPECDKWGCWLSGYAPIVDENGKAVGIVAADISAKDLMAFEKKAKAVILLILAALLVFFPIAFYLLISIFIRPISRITQGLETFKKNFSSRINLRSGDEFEIIADTFNSMAGELENLYRNLERKVEEKTKKLAEKLKEIRQKKAKDEALLSSIGEGMIATDQKGKIIMANPQAETMLGFRLEEFLEKNSLDFIKIEDEKGKAVSQEERPIRIALDKRTKNKGIFYYVRKDGSKFPAQITAAPVILEGKIIGTIEVFRDVTEEREIDKAKSEFVSLASHQLKMPLTNIAWYAEMLLDEQVGKLGPEQKKYVEKLYHSDKKMIELVEALLNVSRIELGTFTVNPQESNLEKTAREIISELKPKILEKELEIVESYDPEVQRFMADPKLMEIILENLLSNSVKYSLNKGKIELSLKKEGRKIVIKVTDFGVGIPQNQKKHIFTKLFRADNVRDMEPNGTGLGLYITKSIVESSAGKIDFESEENKGTTFSVIFPEKGMQKKKALKS